MTDLKSHANAIRARFDEARERRVVCTDKHAVSRPYVECLEIVLQVAARTETRSAKEQAAMVRVAHEVDKTINFVSFTNPLTFESDGTQRRPFAETEQLVKSTYGRDLFGGES